MNVIVDTAIWSLALRRNSPELNSTVVNQLRSLIANGRVIMLGSIRQEILSGDRSRFPQFSSSYSCQNSRI